MTYILLFFSILIFLLLFYLLRSTRKKISEFPRLWEKLLIENVDFYTKLSPADQGKFQKKILDFLNETYIEGVGTPISDLDKILVASSAVIPVFNFAEWHYTNLSSVLLYPENFNEELEYDKLGENKRILGLVGNGQFEHQMILSKKALYEGFSSSHDNNTGVHEFVHLIDKLHGVADGVPERLIKQPYIIPWLKLIHKEMEAINNNHSDIRKYGGTNEAEFLAVASEYFFEQPHKFEKNHPELYKMLTKCFRVPN